MQEKRHQRLLLQLKTRCRRLKYEIADFLYHMMVLMAECGLSWDDVTKELANRR